MGNVCTTATEDDPPAECPHYHHKLNTQDKPLRTEMNQFIGNSTEIQPAPSAEIRKKKKKEIKSINSQMYGLSFHCPRKMLKSSATKETKRKSIIKIHIKKLFRIFRSFED